MKDKIAGWEDEFYYYTWLRKTPQEAAEISI